LFHMLNNAKRPFPELIERFAPKGPAGFQTFY
jgi:hypothetical protein